MESSGTFVLHAFCTSLYSTRKKIFKKEGWFAGCYKKKNCSWTLRFCWPFALGPTPSPSSKMSLLQVGSLLRGSLWAMLHCVIVPAWFARLCALWVIVGHSLFMTHHDSRGKGTNFVHAVCGSCVQSWAVLSSAPRTAYLTQTYAHIFFLSYKKTLLTTTHNKVFSICCKALSVSHRGTFSLPTQIHIDTHFMQFVHNYK